MIPLEEFQRASAILKDKVIKTPLLFSPSLSGQFGKNIYLKLESLQKTGSFKIRGATYKLLRRREEFGPGGVVGASAGNHAQGLALAASEAGIKATIVMPEWVSISKQEATRGYGGEIIIKGDSLEKSIEIARDLARNGLHFIHPYDDLDIITGQGTVALEICDALNGVDMIVVPIGGGGLISGIASVVKSVKSHVRIVGVQSVACPSAYEAVRRKKAFRVRSESSVADGISVKQVGELTLGIILQNVDDIVLVEEVHIASAMLQLLEGMKILVEGAGAVPLAALLRGSLDLSKSKNIVLVVSGGNVDSPLLDRIITQGLTKHGRIMRFMVRLDDRPGSLSKILNIIANLKANVLDIRHERHLRDAPLYVTHVELELETRGYSHSKEIEAELKRMGYFINMD